MYFEIVERFELKNVTFTPGQIVVEGDFPAELLLPWVKLGKIKQHEGQHGVSVTPSTPTPAEPN